MIFQSLLIICLIGWSYQQSCSASCDLVGNYCYIVSSSTMDNAQSQSFCTSIGGQLPFFAVASDLTDYNNYKNSKLPGTTTWLGYWNYNAHSAAAPGVWKDANGNPAPFYSWSGGEPNDCCGGESCLQVLNGDAWNDFGCGAAFNVICMCQCPVISTLANGVVTSPAIIQLNSITSFSCNTGYYLSGPSSIKCVPVGAGINWNASPPVCTRYICPAAFFTSTTGTPVAGSYLSLTSYNFNCGTNYVSGLNPNVVFDSYYCNALGSWSTTFTPCLITCAPITTITNGVVAGGTAVNALNRPVVGSVATFTCNAGYYLNPTGTLTCLSTGSWSTTIPTCIRMQCPNWFNSATGTADPGPYYSGVSYNFACATDYVSATGLSTFDTYDCQAAAPNWVQSSFVPCVATCPPITNLTNGNITRGMDATVVNNRTMAGNSALFICDSGYNLNGNKSLLCLPYGNWSDPEPVCENNCTMTEWSSWSSCSLKCGTGVNTRTRSVLKKETYAGVCWKTTDTRLCEGDSCWELLLGEILLTFSCTFLLGAIGFTFVLNLVWRVRHLERLIHACEEVTLFIAHLFILFLKSVTFYPTVCKITATMIQYCMISCFTFFVLEGVQMYSYATSVLGKGNFFSLKLNLIIGFSVPLIISVPTALLKHMEYPAQFSCWLNWGSLVSLSSSFPIIILGWVAVIIVEAAGMGIFDSIVGRNKTKYVAAKFNQRGLIAVAPACLVHYFIGMFAVYYRNLALCFGVTVAFITLGVLIFIHHGLCHRVIAIWSIKLWYKIKRYKGPLPDWAIEEPEVPILFTRWKRWFYLRKLPKIEPPPPSPVPAPVEEPKKQLPIKDTYSRPPLGPEIWLTREELFGAQVMADLQIASAYHLDNNDWFF